MMKWHRQIYEMLLVDCV